MKASVIVLNKNGSLLLPECLHSLHRQTWTDVEIVVVDNGSIDGSVEFVQEHFPEVRVVRLEENLGFCKGNNIGIRQAKGEYIALLNNDTVVDPHWLEELVRAL
ncbi:MAG TPA: glycosyltransferase family 2 protein, partial [Deltaproteobacteria bacterium]|nr:glycosyltransferase family 2 protein [Deltaproteobacteria bacterium]